MQAYRAALLRFIPNPIYTQNSLVYEADGLLVVGDDGLIAAAGDYAELRPQYPQVSVHDYSGRIIAPGFVDMHVHYPQIDVIGSPAEGLLPWLENYTFPEEAKFSHAQHASETADFFLDELLRNGVTTALCFATSHATSVQALFQAAKERQLRLITGLCLMDQHAPQSVLSDPRCLQESETLIQQWHGKDRLGYAITPRFVPSCTAGLLRGAGELAESNPDVWIQSHVAENRDEVAWVKSLYPEARSYAAVYEQFGLLRARAVYAHGIYLDDADLALFAETKTCVAVSPTSNLFLGSGFFDYARADRAKMMYGLASDVGGGTSFSPFVTMRAAYFVAREGLSKQGLCLSPGHLWWQHTAGAAAALQLQGKVGTLAVGAEADFVVLNPKATPLLARRTAAASNLDELLFAMIILGDDRLVERTHVASVNLGA